MSKSTSKKAVKTAKGKTSKTATAKKVVAKSATKESVVKQVTKEAARDAVQEAVSKKATVRTKRVVDKESILGDFDTLLAGIDTQMTSVRESKVKSAVSIKDLKGLHKQVKQLRSDVNRQIRNKKKPSGERNTNSGFMKPVAISKDMCSFAGWKEGDLHSRVDVTKCICNYVKDHNLQNPKDRRHILADTKLRGLLKLSKSDKEPLTYYSLQRHIQQHFV